MQRRHRTHSQISSVESNPPSQINSRAEDEDSDNHLDQEEDEEMEDARPAGPSQKNSNSNPRESRIAASNHTENEEDHMDEDQEEEEEENEAQDSDDEILNSAEPIVSDKGRSILRKKYNQLFQATKNDARGLDALENIKILNKKLKTGNKYLKKVQLPRESTSDAKFFDQITLIGQEVVNAIEVDNAISPLNVIEFTKSNYGIHVDKPGVNDETEFKSIDWKALGREFMPKFKTAPSCAFMNGPMQLLVEQKPVRKEKRKRASMDDAEEVQPEEMATAETQEKEGDRLFKKIKSKERANNKKVSFFSGVFEDNPNFSNSVDSIFNFSFLVKMGKAKIELDAKNKKTWIQTLDNAVGTSQVSNSVSQNETKQCVMTWNKDMFQRAMALFQNEKAQQQQQSQSQKK